MRIFCQRIVVVFVLGWILVPSGPAEAGVPSAPTLQELIDQADLIVRGRFVDTQGNWEGRRLVTEVDIAVVELYKGHAFAPSDHITVQVEGGFTLQTPVPVAMLWPDRPRLSREDDLLIFLRSTGPGSNLSVVGQGRGVVPLPPSPAFDSADDAQAASFGLLDRLLHLLAAHNDEGTN